MKSKEIDHEIRQLKRALRSPTDPTPEPTGPQKQPPPRKPWRLVVICVATTLATTLAITATAWQWTANQPITGNQRAILSGLVGEIARKTGASRNKVWERIKRQKEIRRIDLLKRGDFDDAVDLLLLDAH